MIKYLDIEEVFKPLDIPISEFNLEEAEVEIDIPCAVYIPGETRALYADGMNYFNLMEVRLELLTEKIDLKMQKKIEEIFEANDVSFVSDMDYSSDHRIYSTVFSFEVMM